MVLYLIPLVLMLLSGCKYGSRYEADIACSKWMKKNQSKYYYCKNDLDTNQILGLDELSKVKKRFKF